MKNLNKLTAVSALLSLMLLMAACGSGGEDAAGAGDAGTEPLQAEDVAEEPIDAEAEGAEAEVGDEGDGEAAASDFDPETYYEGKTIRFVTSSGPGGGTDTKVRTLASQLPRFIPGNPAVQVSNVEPHVAGMNFLWEAPADGTVLGMTAAPTLEFEFFEGANWSSDEWVYIGAMDAVCDNMLLVRGGLGYETIQDVMGAEEPKLVTMTAAPNPADVEPVALGTMLIAEYLDLPLEIKRVAESGTSALNLALERGEINFARYGADWCRIPQANPGWLEEEFVIPILDVATSGPDAQMAAGVEERPPHISELVTEEEYSQWRGLVAAPRAGGNPIFLPPGTPEEVAQILRGAFQAALEDEKFLEAMENAFGGSEIRYLDSDEAETLFTENLEVMTEFQDTYEELADELFTKYVN